MQSFKALLAPTLETPRLRLELFDNSETHYELLLAAMNSPTAHARMGDLGIRTPEQFDEINRSTRLKPETLHNNPTDIDIDTDLYYLLRLRGNDENASRAGPLIGGVSLAQRGPRLPPDAGWCLLEAYHGNAYAAEAARALVDYAREKLGIKDIMAWPGEANEPSRRTAEKAGFVLGGQMEDVDGNQILVYLLPGMDFEAIRRERVSLSGESSCHP